MIRLDSEPNGMKRVIEKVEGENSGGKSRRAR
jgi:hypothetical protein